MRWIVSLTLIAGGHFYSIATKMHAAPIAGEQIGQSLGYAAMTQILEAIQCVGSTNTVGLIKALEGHEFDGLKEGRSYFRSWDHQHVQDDLVGEAFGKELGLGHYKFWLRLSGIVLRGRMSRIPVSCRGEPSR